MSREVRRVEESVEVSRVTQVVADEEPTHLSEAPLVTFDLHFDNLREFLNTVSQAVNQHAKVIRFLSTELKTKVVTTELIEAFRSISLGVPESLKDTVLSSGKSLKEVANDVSAGFKGLSQHVVILNSHAARTDVKLEELRLSVEERAKHTDVKKTVKNAKKKLRDEFNAKCAEVEKLIRSIETGLLDRFNALEKRFGDLELNTLWKLKDCEELLKVRVNEKYVWDALKSLEDKLRRDLISDTRTQMLEKEIKELRRDVEKGEKEHMARLGKVKEELSHCEENLERKPTKEDLQRLLDMIDDLRRSAGAGDLPDKVRDLNDRFEKLVARLNGLKESLLKQSNSGLEEELNRVSRSLLELSERLNKKVDYETLQELLGKLGGRAQTPVLLPAPNSISEDEFGRLKERMMELIRGLEKKMDKYAKDSDLKALMKKVDTKATEEKVNSEFNAQDYRISADERNIEALGKDLEQVQAILRKILGLIESNGSNSALASYKSVPSNCLSCGRGDSKYAPMIPHIKGRDGRLYRADDRMSAGNASTMFHEEHYTTGADVFSLDTHQQAHRESSDEFKLRGSQVVGIKETSQLKSFRIRPQSAKK